ncbi:Uncharacterised protein [Salmonella enterica subsp. enterica serovar Typhimurium str. DT104]|nr:Uncharacterised protein [Salmonella enterica subsp. enterica serovar Typhimurium str. DT104]
MSKTFWNPKLSLILSRQIYTNPLTKSRRFFSDIDRNIKNLTDSTTN